MSTEYKLYMVLLGCKPEGRHVEQHDVFFGIATTLKALVVEMEAFWPGSGKLHIDAWREVNSVEDYKIQVLLRNKTNEQSAVPGQKLFFINLGGYQQNKFEEQHYTLLTVKPDSAAAMKEAKQSLFFKNNHFGKAVSHIDDKYGIDVDELYEIEEILSPAQRNVFQIVLVSSVNLQPDEINLGYLKLSSLK